jgi:hypothetical protein
VAPIGFRVALKVRGWHQTFVGGTKRSIGLMGGTKSSEKIGWVAPKGLDGWHGLHNRLVRDGSCS